MSSENPMLKVHGPADDEHDNRSRSPHLYALRRPDKSTGIRGNPNFCEPQLHPVNVPDKDSPSIIGSGSKIYSDIDNRKRRKDSTTPSDSGTEADDESGPLLKGLPAPPVRPRKGLKNEATFGTPSPLLTPSYLDDEKRREALEAQFKRRSSLQSHTSTDEETLRIREKFVKRRRAELIRRTTETTLFLSVGCTACWKLLLLPVPRELLVFACIVCGTYLLYPMRLFLYHRLLPSELRQSRRFLRVPAAFDPATLLYPALLPLFVAASLSPKSNLCMTTNLVLGIAAMPRTIIPSQDSFSGHTSVQYLLSVLSIASVGNDTGGSYKSHGQVNADPEILSLLYPLHQALLPTLGYLTTTSLLPAELQLLSVSMVNILLLSSSPQALILQAILWIGGLSVYVLCKRVLQWEVALARIPTWRFRREIYPYRLHVNIRRILKELMEGRLSFETFVEEDSEDSDNEPQNIVGSKAHTRPRGSALAMGNHSGIPLKIKRAVPPLPPEPFVMQWPMKRNSKPRETRRQRRNTLPSFTGPLNDYFALKYEKNSYDTIYHFNMPKNFRSLTKDQATIVKWFYALYTYAVAIVLVAVPIRIYVSRWVLHDQEPVGWALGYLFRDIARFRSVITETGLRQWIPIPPSDFGAVDIHGWAEEVRWQALGAANTRLLICSHCICTIASGLAVVFQLSNFADVDTRRKVFHGMMVMMFLPTIFIDPTFVALALILVLAIFLLLDLFRASQLPPVSRPLTYFLAPYVDGRDHCGPVIVSPIFLLIGCSIPLWLSLGSMQRSGIFPWQGWEVPSRNLSMVSGVICVGMGDAAASLVGRRYGRRRWCWSGGKSLEGSTAFAAAVLVGLTLARLWLLYGGWEGDSGDSWPLFLSKAAVAASGVSLTEAVLTGGNDNVIVPVILWLLVRGLAI
ncbi:MAG: hypothetical protein Q9225_002017 [Loekoesia sp. 1 TL-2023]